MNIEEIKKEYFDKFGNDCNKTFSGDYEALKEMGYFTSEHVKQIWNFFEQKLQQVREDGIEGWAKTEEEAYYAGWEDGVRGFVEWHNRTPLSQSQELIKETGTINEERVEQYQTQKEEV